MKRVALALIAMTALTAIAHADADSDADAAFRRARSSPDPIAAIGQLETLGAARPITRWTDDAWTEAARLAEATGDSARAIRDLHQALAVTTDPLLARRARAALARLEPLEGFAGVAAAHEALVDELQRGSGDPKSALVELGAIVLANPGYPRRAIAMLALARGWERDGSPELARQWLERAQLAASGPAEIEHVTAERARFELRAGDPDASRAAISAVRDHQLRAELDQALDRADWRRRLRTMAWAVLAALTIAAAVAIRRGAGSWRAAAHRLARPPVEAWFLAPIALVLTLVAATGNPLVARAVRAISISGVAVAWISGVLLPSRPRLRIAALHGLLAAIAVISATYIAVDRDRMIDIVIETWRGGPSAR